MKPVKTAESNLVYRGPSADVGDLWCERIRPGEIASVWEPSEEERETIAAGGRIRLTLWNEPIPPITLDVLAEKDSQPTGEHPFRIPGPESNGK